MVVRMNCQRRVERFKVGIAQYVIDVSVCVEDAVDFDVVFLNFFQQRRDIASWIYNDAVFAFFIIDNVTVGLHNANGQSDDHILVSL